MQLRRMKYLAPNRRSLIPGALLLFGSLGCGGGTVSEQFNKGLEQAKESVNKGVEQAKETAKQVTDTAKQATTTATEVAGLAGKITLTSNPPITTSGAYAQFTPGSAAKNGAIAFQSYAPNHAETFPSVFVKALTTAATLNELSGKSLPCEIFVQAQQDGPVWRITAGDKAELKVIAIEGKIVKAEITSASVHETSAEQSITFTGAIEATLP